MFDLTLGAGAVEKPQQTRGGVMATPTTESNHYPLRLTVGLATPAIGGEA